VTIVTSAEHASLIKKCTPVLNAKAAKKNIGALVLIVKMHCKLMFWSFEGRKNCQVSKMDASQLYDGELCDGRPPTKGRCAQRDRQHFPEK
jgi:hypothetical protein